MQRNWMRDDGTHKLEDEDSREWYGEIPTFDPTPFIAPLDNEEIGEELDTDEDWDDDDDEDWDEDWDDDDEDYDWDDDEEDE